MTGGEDMVKKKIQSLRSTFRKELNPPAVARVSDRYMPIYIDNILKTVNFRNARHELILKRFVSKRYRKLQEGPFIVTAIKQVKSR